MATIDSVKLPDNSTYDLTDNYSGYQTETLATPLTINGTQETTVEGALGAVNDYADKIKGSMSNENLLLNPSFKVNERGQASYSLHDDYTVNNWKMDYSGGAASVSVTASGLTLTGAFVYINQPFGSLAPLVGKTLTASILLSDNTIKAGTGTWAGTDLVFVNDSGIILTLAANNAVGFLVTNTSGNPVDIKAVKLELGSISTLANDIAPDYALELAKCQTSTADPSDTYANKGNLVNYADLTTIHATGSTNTTGAQIDAGTFFYLNDQFCKALTNIAANATFTLNTNFKVDTAGEEIFNNRKHKGYGTRVVWDADSTVHDIPSDGMIVGVASADSVLTLYCNTYDWGFVASGTSANSNTVTFPCHAGERWSSVVSGTGAMMFIPYTY